MGVALLVPLASGSCPLSIIFARKFVSGTTIVEGDIEGIGLVVSSLNECSLLWSLSGKDDHDRIEARV